MDRQVTFLILKYFPKSLCKIILIREGLYKTGKILAAFCDGNHRLSLPPHHQFLLWSKQLMATDFAEKSTQRTRHHGDAAELNLEPKCFFLEVITKTPELILFALFHSSFALMKRIFHC